jgi:hypothetical protein
MLCAEALTSPVATKAVRSVAVREGTMDVNRIKLLVVIIVAVLALALESSPSLAGFNDRPAAYNGTSAPFKCTQVWRDQLHTDGQPGNRNPNGPRTNCEHSR